MAVSGALADLYIANGKKIQAAKSAKKAVERSAKNASLAPSKATYDFTRMTPNTMREVAQSLYVDGKINLQQAFNLHTMGMPLGKMGEDGKFRSLSASEQERYNNAPINYIERTQGVLGYIAQSGNAADPESGYQSWQGILTALQASQK